MARMGYYIPLNLWMKLLIPIIIPVKHVSKSGSWWGFREANCQGINQQGPLARYAKLRVAHAPGMPGTFSPPPRVSDSDIHHGTCVTHVPWCMPWSLTSGFLWGRRQGKRSWHSRRMRNPQFCVSGKRPMLSAYIVQNITCRRHVEVSCELVVCLLINLSSHLLIHLFIQSFIYCN